MAPVAAVCLIFTYGTVCLFMLPSSECKMYVFLIMVPALILGNAMMTHVFMHTYVKASIAVVFYMLPGVAHALWENHTVLFEDDANILSMLENVFMLLPYTLASMAGTVCKTG